MVCLRSLNFHKFYRGRIDGDKQDIFNTFVRSSNSSVNFDIFSTMRPDLFLRSASCSNYGVGIYFGGGLQSNFTTDVKVGLSVGLCIYYSLFNF